MKFQVVMYIYVRKKLSNFRASIYMFSHVRAPIFKGLFDLIISNLTNEFELNFR